MNNNEALAALGTLATAISVFILSRYLGADFSTTLYAMIWTAFTLGVAILFKWKLEWPTGFLGFAFIAATWPAWWDVLDSIAAGGMHPREINDFVVAPTWYAHSVTKWAVETFAATAMIWRISAWRANGF